MRAVVQRTRGASVSVAGEVVGAIDSGLLVFLGVEAGDQDEDLLWLCQKLPQIRIFEDDAGKMNVDVRAVGGNILLISQFTLFGNLRKGTRPSFNHAAPPAEAEALYLRARDLLSGELGKPVATGRFAADMRITASLDGPVTLFLDSRHKDL